MPSKKIEVQGLQIRIEPVNKDDYISLTDLALKGDSEPRYVLQNWIKNASTIEFLFAWEQMHNDNLKKGVQMHTLLARSAQNRFSMSPKKWVELTNAIGIKVKMGRGGGVYAHKDIALNLCYWLSPTFQVYMIKEFQRLKEEEAERTNLEWHITNVTDLLDEARNWMDTIPGQEPSRNRLQRSLDKKAEQDKINDNPA